MMSLRDANVPGGGGRAPVPAVGGPTTSPDSAPPSESEYGIWRCRRAHRRSAFHAGRRGRESRGTRTRVLSTSQLAEIRSGIRPVSTRPIRRVSAIYQQEKL